MNPTLELAVRTGLGALLVILVQLLARSENYYIAGMVPLFPTFALLSHYIVGKERTVAELRRTILLTILTLAPYSVYLIVLYLLVGRLELRWSLLVAVAAWGVATTILLAFWSWR
jgi:membrane protein GlpM